MKAHFAGAMGIAATVLGAAAQASVIDFQAGVSPTAGYTTQGTYVYTGVSPGFAGMTANNNNSGSQSLIVAENNTNTGIGESWGTANTLLGFNISAIPAGAAISSVELVLTAQGGGVTGEGTSITVNVNQLASTFTASTATWSNLSPPGGALTGTLLSSLNFDPTLASATAEAFVSSPNFVSAAQSALNSDGNLTMILNGGDATTDAFARFYYDESNAPAADRPELIVNYAVPEPAAMALFGIGGMMLLLHRVRRKLT